MRTRTNWRSPFVCSHATKYVTAPFRLCPFGGATHPLQPVRRNCHPETAGVLVIGSGFTGLSAALVLARVGRDVVVVDAGVPGYGASTRNGGQVGSGNQKFRRQDADRHAGRTQGGSAAEKSSIISRARACAHVCKERVTYLRALRAKLRETPAFVLMQHTRGRLMKGSAP